MSLFALWPFVLAAQDWHGQGSVKSREYKREIRGDAGVEATEFFSLEYSVEIQIVDIGQTPTYLSCENICQGKKHKEHRECDFSCDTKCPEKAHKKSLRGWYTPNRDGMNAATTAANGLAVRGGGTVSPSDWSHRVSNALAQFRADCRKQRNFDMPHAGPCSAKWWSIGTNDKAFRVRGTMKKVGYRMSRGVRTPIDQVVGRHEQEVAQGGIVAENPLAQNETVLCRCFEVPKPAEIKKNWLGMLGASMDPRRQEELMWRLTRNGVTCYDTGGNLLFDAQVEVAVTGNDMNTVRLVLTNKSGQTVRVVLPPGTIFLPSLSDYQKMASLMQSEETIEAGETEVLYVNVRPAPAPGGEMSFRWACLEMAKKEPNPNVKYSIAPTRDDALIDLCGITARSRFRGAHDQARVWIYTDKAPREEINKRMIPGVGAATYAMLLKDVAEKAGIDLAQPEWRALVQPSLLEGLSVDDRSVYWLVNFLAEHKARDLAAFLGGRAEVIAQLPVKEGKDGAEYVGWVAQALLLEESTELKQAGAKLLLAVPAEARASVAENGGLEGLRWLVTGNQEVTCSLAMDVFEAYGPAGAELLKSSIEAMPTDALKSRAAKLAGIELPEDAR